MKKNESGRSMVEMLGVLAVMSVLALGGITGYVLAINRQRANNVLDVAGKLAAMGVGGKTFNNLASAGLETDAEGVDMQLYRTGVVCIRGLKDEMFEAVEALAIPFRVRNQSGCTGDDVIGVKFAKRKKSS